MSVFSLSRSRQLPSISLFGRGVGARPNQGGKEAHLIIPRKRSLEDIEPNTPRIEHHIRLIVVPPAVRSRHHPGQHLARHEVQHRVRRRVRVPVQVIVSRGVTKHVGEVVQPRGGMESAREGEAGRGVETLFFAAAAAAAARVVSVLPGSDTSGQKLAASAYGRGEQFRSSSEKRSGGEQRKRN